MAGAVTPSWLSATDVNTADEEPGIYAWYATLFYGTSDWQQLLDPNGVDIGMSRFGTLLAEQTARVVPPSIRVGAVGHLWARWSGILAEGGNGEIQKAIRSTHGSPAAGPAALRSVMQRADLREATAEVLAMCSPHVSAPLYIGVATNLRTRLGQHLMALREGIAEMAANGGTPTDAMRGSFGGRAAAAQFTEEMLSVATFPISSGALTVDERRTIAEAAEFLLNRWSRPIFGRQ